MFLKPRHSHSGYLSRNPTARQRQLQLRLQWELPMPGVPTFAPSNEAVKMNKSPLTPDHVRLDDLPIP
jgi:hypothetical protein